MNLRPEIQERIKTARAVLDAIERSEEVQWNCQTQANPKWIDTNASNVLDFFSFYRAKPKPVTYTVAELLEQGIHYVMSGGDIWTVRAMNTVRNTLAVDTIYHNALMSVEHEPEWFACRDFLWSADGKNWNNFRKEKQ